MESWVRGPDDEGQHTPKPVEQQASQVQVKPGTRPITPLEGSATHQRRFKVTPKKLYSSLYKATRSCRALVTKPLQNIWHYSQTSTPEKAPRYVSQV